MNGISILGDCDAAFQIPPLHYIKLSRVFIGESHV